MTPAMPSQSAVVGTSAQYEAPENKVAPGLLVTSTEVIGTMAMWAVRQHPRHMPPGLDLITARLLEETAKWTDGVPSLPMCRFAGWSELEEWLETSLKEHPVLRLWNSCERGETPDYAFTSRYDGPRDPDRDFIDISALLRNVALSVIREAQRQRDNDMPSVVEAAQ